MSRSQSSRPRRASHACQSNPRRLNELLRAQTGRSPRSQSLRVLFPHPLASRSANFMPEQTSITILVGEGQGRECRTSWRPRSSGDSVLSYDTMPGVVPRAQNSARSASFVRGRCDAHKSAPASVAPIAVAAFGDEHFLPSVEARSFRSSRGAPVAARWLSQTPGPEFRTVNPYQCGGARHAHRFAGLLTLLSCQQHPCSFGTKHAPLAKPWSSRQ